MIQAGLADGELEGFRECSISVLGTAGWRWTHWISHRILNYLTTCLASWHPKWVGYYIPSHFPWFGMAGDQGGKGGRKGRQMGLEGRL